jgi:hypothetical protein
LHKEGFFVNSRFINIRKKYEVYTHELVVNSDVNKFLYYYFIYLLIIKLIGPIGLLKE